jgi:hypothetical protein
VDVESIIALECRTRIEQQRQAHNIHEALNAFHVRYYATENRGSKLVGMQKSYELCRELELWRKCGKM